MLPLRIGRYVARVAGTAGDLRSAQKLRQKSFFKAAAAGSIEGLDQDRFDGLCQHILVEDGLTNDPVCCFRLMQLAGGWEVDRSYSAQFYGLSALRAHRRPMIEVGRFCIDPDNRDPNILRIAWAAITRLVDASGAQLLFGCSSFQGTQAARHLDAFALLRARHLAPDIWLPQIKSKSVFAFAQMPPAGSDVRGAMAKMPPLLRSYLAMGGWVSDHAVVDRDLDTLHVFTGLEIGSIPPARARILRALAG